ncbi:dihydropteroate synthase [Rubricella aquisinus]|uniref:Dihydropteroate synthase n=1 Tax=Rubricella aquisinus TaxID=2028108 RepID=A0A840WME3_9RHOB|nr:dihydropteroate synthase [Rubricella aquisinus]MBB5516229.1 dihydropteroate synthase [Rubricella aquisinus]
MIYYRPLAQTGPRRPGSAVPLAGGWAWFTHVEALSRGAPGRIVSVADVPADALARLTGDRAPMAGLSMARPHLMGILNVTPDSFSDGGRLSNVERVRERAGAMVAAGASLLDIGGESTRPGAALVPVAEEMSRVMPALEAVQGLPCAISVDTRKAEVARAALNAGAHLFNDVSALTFDPASMDVLRETGAPVCLMHALGDPATMQDAPRYDDVLLDVYDFLEARIAACEAAGISRSRIMVDPGIGFGKTLEHNLTLLRGLSLFHGLGCPILLGVSRKRFIGTIGGAAEADQRAPGSIAVGLEGIRQGAQVLRVHDLEDTAQALALWQAVAV